MAAKGETELLLLTTENNVKSDELNKNQDKTHTNNKCG